MPEQKALGGVTNTVLRYHHSPTCPGTTPTTDCSRPVIQIVNPVCRRKNSDPLDDPAQGSAGSRSNWGVTSVAEFHFYPETKSITSRVEIFDFRQRKVIQV